MENKKIEVIGKFNSRGRFYPIKIRIFNEIKLKYEVLVIKKINYLDYVNNKIIYSSELLNEDGTIKRSRIINHRGKNYWYLED